MGSNEREMEQLIEATITRVTTSVRGFPNNPPSNAEIAREIACSLRDAGYVKSDPYELSFIEQLRHGLIGLRANLKEIKESVSFLDLSDDKCATALRIIEHVRERHGVKS